MVNETTEKILNRIKESHPPKNQEAKEITRKETAIYLEVTPPTVDQYTREGLLTKYGTGKRGKYLENEVEAAKPIIRASLYKHRTRIK